jgi:cation/acetate symporter
MNQQFLTTSLFLFVVAITIGVTLWASRQTKTAADFYSGGRSFSGFQNGLAIGGDYMSAASFLGISGAIALYGYDGFLYSIGFLVAWLVALLLVAEMLRNAGRYTMADQLAFRMRQRPVRTAAATSTVIVSIFYLIVIVGVGALMIFYVTVGGMKGTTYVQIIKAVLLMAGSALIVFLVLLKFDFNLSALLGEAADRSGQGDAFLQPGLQYGTTFLDRLDFLSLGIALVLGTAGLPHILIRFYTVPTAQDARKSVLWAIGLIGAFYLMTLVLGFGAAALIDTSEAGKTGNLASPLLAQEVGGGEGSVGGAVLLALIAAVAFATILAVVAGLTLASSSSMAHDLYKGVFKRDQEVTEKQEVRVAKISAIVIGAIAIALAIPAQRLNIAFLVALAFAVAASANLPSILFNMFWKRFNTRGATWSIYGGLIASVGLVLLSPVTSGEETSLLPNADFAIFPLNNPGVVSIPVGFLLGIIGTLTLRETAAEQLYTELEVRALTGAGAEGAAQH